MDADAVIFFFFKEEDGMGVAGESGGLGVFKKRQAKEYKFFYRNFFPIFQNFQKARKKKPKKPANEQRRSKRPTTTASTICRTCGENFSQSDKTNVE